MASRSVRVLGADLSQPTRAVLWICKLVNVEAPLERIDSSKGEQNTAEYHKLNPNGKYPVLIDGGFVLSESHAIMRYLVEKYASEDLQKELYPASDIQVRAIVDSWLDWKHSNLRVGAAGLFRRLALSKIGDLSKHSARFDLVEIPQEREERILTSSLQIMEEQLNKSSYIAGTEYATLADIALITEIDQLSLLDPKLEPPTGSDFSKSYPGICAWADRLHAYPFYQEGNYGLLQAQVKFAKLRNEGKL